MRLHLVFLAGLLACWTAPAAAQEIGLTCEAIVLPAPITFAPGDEALDPSGEALVARVAELLAANPWIERLDVRVHTDSSGAESFNLRTSRKRAAAVVSTLTRLGIDPERLRSEGVGEAQPIAPNTTAEGRAQNRRVELRIHATACPLCD